MTKNFILSALVAVALTACGNSSSTTISKDGIKTDKASVTKDGVKTDDASVTKDGVKTDDASVTKNGITTCPSSGNTVLVDEGTSCMDNSHTVTCHDNKVTVDAMITGRTVTLNGRTYTCQ